MAVQIFPLSLFANLKVFKDTDSDATSENNINAAALTVYVLIIDNTLNPSQNVFTKLYNNAAPTIGTTVPDMIFKTQGGVSRSWFFPEGIPFATALSFATVTAGGTGGTTNPTADVTVTIIGA